MSDTRLKIAVFIDFDNIEIGVKSTLNAQFDIGVVLEALKERGEVVSKIAYGDWTRAGDYSRSLTQHATKLVQRNLTPGGDKNGADINLALDALETAFTHPHINAYVIVGGDSDFITLVEKLKQYDKQVFIVGGRAFTSQVMQRNCHEFIAYENLIGGRRPDRGRQGGAPVREGAIEQAMPLVRRALKVLIDREVTPQLGLLKSTLLQLDSTFSERNYGVSSFRDFAQKLANAGFVVLREHGRNVLVELKENGHHTTAHSQAHEPHAAAEHEAPHASEERPQPTAHQGPPRAAEGIREVRRLFQSAQNPPRWPMYVRQVKQFLRGVDPAFDERKFGFASLVDLLRACQREGLFRIDRDRQGVMRVFGGNVMQMAAEPMEVEDASTQESEPSHEAGRDTEIVEGAVVQEVDAAPPVLDGVEARSSTAEDVADEQPIEAEPSEPARPRRRRAASGSQAGRQRKSPARPRAPRKPKAATVEQ